MAEEMIIQPVREPGETGIPKTGLLALLPSVARQAHGLLGEIGAKRQFLYNSQLRTCSEGGGDCGIFTAGPAIGAPMAVMTLEKLIALGAGKVIVYGWCGALRPELGGGDILLPTWGVVDEGTSGHYPGSTPPESSAALRGELRALVQRAGYPFQEGPVWTTDALYRESRQKVRDCAARGVLGVDMEYTALVRVAEFRQVELAAVFLVSDELWRSDWRPGFRSRLFKRRDKDIISLIVEYLLGADLS